MSLASPLDPLWAGGSLRIGKLAPHRYWRRPRASATDPAAGNSAAWRATSATVAPASSAAWPSPWPVGLHSWPARTTRRLGRIASLPLMRAPSARATPATSSHTAGPWPATCPPDKTSLAPPPASPPIQTRSGCRDPSATPAAPCRTGFRSGPESFATSSCPRCCRPSLHRPAEVRSASSPARSLLACNPDARRDYSRTWLWDSAQLLLPRMCSSGHTAAHRTPHRTDLSSVAVNARTDLACEPAPDPDTGTTDLFPPLQNPAPAKRPSRSDRTTAGAHGTRCQDRSAGSPPTALAPEAKQRFPAPAAASRTRNDPVATAATTRIPTSSCHTVALAPASSR